jgi:glutaredoxin 3
MESEVTVFTMTTCPFCLAAKKLLRKKGVEFVEVNLDDHPERWAECESRSGRATVPQVFFGERHIGGCDDLQALEKRGELDRLIASLRAAQRGGSAKEGPRTG